MIVGSVADALAEPTKGHSIMRRTFASLLLAALLALFGTACASDAGSDAEDAATGAASEAEEAASEAESAVSEEASETES
jgi:hypothetical protein